MSRVQINKEMLHSLPSLHITIQAVPLTYHLVHLKTMKGEQRPTTTQPDQQNLRLQETRFTFFFFLAGKQSAFSLIQFSNIYTYMCSFFGKKQTNKKIFTARFLNFKLLLLGTFRLFISGFISCSVFVVFSPNFWFGFCLIFKVRCFAGGETLREE